MRFQNTILLPLILLLSSIASAQNVEITEAVVAKVGDSVAISFNAKVAKISTNHMLTLTPVLWGGGTEQVLQPIIVMGRNKSITQARKGIVAMDGVRANSATAATYRVTIPLAKWMDSVSLRLDGVLEWCSNKETLPSVEIASNQLVPILPTIIPLFDSDVKTVYLGEFKPSIEDYPFVHLSGTQADQELGGLDIYFQQGSSTIKESHSDNKNSIRKIREAIELIRAEDNIELTKITIKGGASPEGGFLHNKRLGQSRSKSFINYFSGDISRDLFEIKNIGENWEGLYSMVEDSEMEYKDEVLVIIDSYPILEGREERLIELKGGDPYRYMLKEFFPELRNASYVQVFYDVKPNAEFAQIDKASELIKAKSYSEALEILLLVTPTPYTDNLTGVCYMMGEDAANARVYLQRAIEGGDRNARKNLEQLDSSNGNIQHK